MAAGTQAQFRVERNGRRGRRNSEREGSSQSALVVGAKRGARACSCVIQQHVHGSADTQRLLPDRAESSEISAYLYLSNWRINAAGHVCEFDNGFCEVPPRRRGEIGTVMVKGAWYMENTARALVLKGDGEDAVSTVVVAVGFGVITGTREGLDSHRAEGTRHPDRWEPSRSFSDATPSPSAVQKLLSEAIAHRMLQRRQDPSTAETHHEGWILFEDGFGGACFISIVRIVIQTVNLGLALSRGSGLSVT
ncbi:hypothetical protein B0H11DRAFT_2193373 [Mycena galericulata]|nr:hypothetical protein B0H11DRAFT_2193373 [Mycena galericulata]